MTKAALDAVLGCPPSTYFSKAWTDTVKMKMEKNEGPIVAMTKEEDTCGLLHERIDYCVWDEDSLMMTRPMKLTKSTRPTYTPVAKLPSHHLTAGGSFLTAGSQQDTFCEWAKTRDTDTAGKFVHNAVALLKAAGASVSSLYEAVANDMMKNSL